MHPLWWFAIVTFIVVVVLLGYMMLSHRRLEKHDGKAKGIGGVNDPISGARPLDRHPADMAESLKARDG